MSHDCKSKLCEEHKEALQNMSDTDLVNRFNNELESISELQPAFDFLDTLKKQRLETIVKFKFLLLQEISLSQKIILEIAKEKERRLNLKRG